MPAPAPPVRRLPARPSAERLRKLAKRLARDQNIALAAAQWRIARGHGFVTWAELIREVKARARPRASPLSLASSRGAVEQVRRFLERGDPVDGDPRETDTPLYLACDGEAPAPARIAIARLLIDAGALVRRGCTDGATPLHAAARRGPAELVELLLRHGAFAWQRDAQGRCAHDYAEAGDPIERDRILFLTADGPRIEDPDFRAAVAAIHGGDIPRLAQILDARPGLLHERAIEPDIGPRGYFSDPRLIWFVANNPSLVQPPPPNIVEAAKLMIARGARQTDLEYTLELAMTGDGLPRELQLALVGTLVEAGAVATPSAIVMTLGHRQTAPIEWLLDRGLEPTVAIAAGLGRVGALRGLLATATMEETSDALALAVINRQIETARICLEAGADPNRFMPCHSHSTPLHQAALHGDIEMMKLLLAYGARWDTEDKLWRGTPLGWAIHGKQEEAEAYLRSLA